MARARNLKPGFFHNADLVELPVETRLLFAGLWLLADREGRLEDRPKQIKMEIYPADAFDVDAMLSQLQDSGFIERYEVNGNRYIQVLKFNKHQNPHRAEKASTIPAPCKHSADTVLVGLIPDSGFLIPESGSERQQGATTPGRQAAQTQTPNPSAKSADNAPLDADPAPSTGTETPPPGENPPGPEPNADAITARAVEIAVLLRNRGAGVAAGEARLRDWARRGITDATLLTALETAVQRRTAAGSAQPVNSGLLDSILADVTGGGTGPPARASPRGGGKQAAREAYLADAAAAAHRLGMDAGFDRTGGTHGSTEHDISGECARVA